MTLSGFEILDILEIIIFTPLLAASIFVTYKHGMRKQLGWRFLVMISLFRLIGACTSLASVHHPSEGLTITYDIMNSFGLSAVIYCALGLLVRVQSGMDMAGLPPQFFRLLGLPGIAGLVLCILGSINIFSNDESDQQHGFEYFKAAMILFAVVYAADVAITFLSFRRISHVQLGDKRLLQAVAMALPFMAVRTVFGLLCAWADNPKYFSSWSLHWVAVVVHGCLGILMEIICVVIFLWAGFTTAPAQRPAVHRKVGPPAYGPNVFTEEVGQGK